MPVLRDWDLALDADKVLWGQGADPAIIRARRPRLAALAEAVIEEGRPLLAPAILYRRIPVVGLRHERLLLAGGGVLLGPLIAGHLAAASEVIVVICTVGDGLSRIISNRFQTDPVHALALEGLAAAAAEALAEAACRRFEAQARAEGLQASIPLNPGMIGKPLVDGQPKAGVCIAGYHRHCRQLRCFGLNDAGQVGISGHRHRSGVGACGGELRLLRDT